ncbi:MAG: hypothetical protein ABIF87_04160 [Pseudomonadota bacterium]
MPQCKKCGKKGLLLRLEEKTGLCSPCNAAFEEMSRHLTEEIMENVNSVVRPDDPETIVSRCDQIEESISKLISLHEEYSLKPSSVLLYLMSWSGAIKQRALSATQK